MKFLLSSLNVIYWFCDAPAALKFTFILWPLSSKRFINMRFDLCWSSSELGPPYWRPLLNEKFDLLVKWGIIIVSLNMHKLWSAGEF